MLALGVDILGYFGDYGLDPSRQRRASAVQATHILSRDPESCMNTSTDNLHLRLK
jgi:hypothetical protein